MTILTNPLPMVFTSSDELVAIVSVTGLVTPLTVGNAIITVKLESDSAVSDSINIIVEEPPITHNYSIIIVGTATTIKLSRTESYTCQFFDNSAEVFDQSATWTVTNTDGSPTTIVSITSQTGNSVTLLASSLSANANKYFNLVCTLNSDTSINVSKQIKIINLF